MISLIALRRLGLSKVWWLVSPGNPLKAHAEQAPLADRLALCRRMANDPRIEVTGFEAELPTPFTASTLRFLKERYPRTRFVWIMGADNLAGFERWLRWREIFLTVPIAVVDRPGWRLKALASKPAQAFAAHRIPEGHARALREARAPAWTFLSGPLSELSSSALRQRSRGRRRAAKPGPASRSRPPRAP
jgi:nicotinate-nucleotide adenylyltransferase